MKRIALFVLSITAAAGVLQAQDSMVYRPSPLNARLITARGQFSDGYLYAVSDTALLLSREKRRPNFHDTAAREGIRSFAYQDLKFVTIHKRGGTGTAVLIGAFIGFATGAIVGYASGDDPQNQWFALTAGQKAGALGTFGGVIGAITGLIVGVAAHRTFEIDGKKERFDKMSRALALRMGQ